MTVRVAGPGFGPVELAVPLGARVLDVLSQAGEQFAQPLDLTKVIVWMNGERVTNLDREVQEHARIVAINNFVGG